MKEDQPEANNRLQGRGGPALKEVSLLFLKLGAFSFGGPAAYIAIMQRETVRERHWIDDQDFLDLVGATNLIPGPNATEIAIHLGLKRAGWRGFLSAGLLFIIPGMLATMAVAWAYVQYGALPQVDWVLYGIKPVVIAIILQALSDLGKRAVKGWVTALAGLAVVGLYLLGVNEILLLFSGAAAVMLVYAGRRYWRKGAPAAAILPFLKLPSMAAGAAASFSQLGLFLSFLKIGGAVLYGSGYVLVAFMKSEFVTRLGWITNQQLLDAIAVGQATPGPVFSSRHLRRLPGGEVAGGTRGYPGHISTVFRLCRFPQSNPPLDKEVALGKVIPRWRECSLARFDGRGHMVAR